jgi:hypothetical protein
LPRFTEKSRSPCHSVTVLLGNGDGTFRTAGNFPAGTSAYSLAVGDFNGDGLPDLAVPGAGGTRLLLGNGDGTFQTTNVSYVTGYSTSVAVGDFNGDGLPDLAVTDSVLTGSGLAPPRGPAVPRGGPWLPRRRRCRRRKRPNRHGPRRPLPRTCPAISCRTNPC